MSKKKHFKELKPSLPDIDGEVYIQAVITKKDNEPALFQTVLRTIRKVGNHYSLLFVGHIQKNTEQICRTPS
ncbi:YwpF family protein [Peribacillus frigoritolerans]|nr:YwpF family protein [Peribacillus frigoritolerans]